MKIGLFVIVFLFLSINVFSQKKLAQRVKFSTETIDFGKVKKDIPAKGEFVMTNIGNDQLTIEESKTSCNCTVTDFTKEPIAPGKTGTVTEQFDAKHPGPFMKIITVKFTGIKEVKTLTISGQVIESDK